MTRKKDFLMKLRTVLPMLAVATFALAACAPKVDYAKFHELAVEAAKEAAKQTFEKVTFDGWYKDGDKKEEIGKVEIKFKEGVFVSKTSILSDAELAAKELAVAAMLNVMVAEAIPEDEKTTYYAGGSFKVVTEDEDGKYTAEFNKYGLLTSMSGDDGKYTVKYSN